MYDVELQNDGNFSPAEMKQFTKVFNSVDADGSGQVTADELQDCLLQLGHPDAHEHEKVVEMLNRVDADKTGAIELDEFVDLLFVELKDPELCEAPCLENVPHHRMRLPPR